jgi:hypothetical protein
MTADHDVGVLHARGEHADSHLAPSGNWQGSVDDCELLGTAEAPDLNNPVARLAHGSLMDGCSAAALPTDLTSMNALHAIARKKEPPVIEEDQ